MRTCAYCGGTGNITGEHLYPKCLSEAREGNRVYSTDYREDAFVGRNALQVDDVCATCNNESLSQLDSYFCKLYKSQIAPSNRSNIDHLDLNYEYSSLIRFVLKMVYNQTRATKSGKAHVERLAKYRDCAIGEADVPKNLFLAARVNVADADADQLYEQHMVITSLDVDGGDAYIFSIDHICFILGILPTKNSVIDSKYVPLLYLSLVLHLGFIKVLPASQTAIRIEVPEKDYFDPYIQILLSNPGKWTDLLG